MLFEYVREINLASLILRLFLASIISGIIGFEREEHKRPAGLKHIF